MEIPLYTPLTNYHSKLEILKNRSLLFTTSIKSSCEKKQISKDLFLKNLTLNDI